MFGLKLGELLIIALACASLAVPILFLLTWASTLRLTRPHQKYAPGLVWLMLIPGINLVWQFFLLRAATRGIKGRIQELGGNPGDGGFGVGLAYQALACLTFVMSLGNNQHPSDQVNVVVGVLFLVSVVLWVIYWVRISRFNRAMATPTVAVPTALAS